MASADTRASILDAALQVIGEDGLAAFTQPRVAARAGLRQSHLTYYFPTRDALLVAVAGRVVAERVATLDTVAAARTPRTKVAALATILTDPEQTRLLLALFQAVDTVPDVRAVVDRLAEGVVPGAAALLTSWGVATTPTALELLQTTSTGIAVLALANGGPAYRATAVRLLTRLLADLAHPAPADPPTPRTT